MTKCIIPALLTFVSTSNALDSWNTSVAEILPGSGDLDNPTWVVNIERPGDKAAMDLIAAYDENNYMPYGYCNDIVDESGENFKEGTFHVETLNGVLKRHIQDNTWPAADRWHLYYGLHRNLWQ